jgi:hypothetical protein
MCNDKHALDPTDPEVQRLVRSNGIIEMMVRHGLSLTRDNYVDIANAGRPDDAWTHEHEAMVPRILRCPEQCDDQA